MRTSSFGYLIKEGARNIYTNRLMSLASVGVLMACLLLIGASVLFSLNISSFVGYAEDQNEVVAFLYDGLDGEYLQELDKRLEAIDNLTDIRYISRDQGLDEWVKGIEGAEESGLFDGLYSDNIMPDSYRMRVTDLSRLDETVEAINAIEGIDTVRAPVEVAQTITSLKQAVTVGGTAIVLLLIAVASVIIANTIKITVFNRRKEINIMKFVGATDTFIRLPFVVEGLLLGLLSAVLSFGILWGGYNSLVNWLSKDPVSWFTVMVENMILFKDIALPLFAAFAVMGIGIGTIGSMIFVRKYLKV